MTVNVTADATACTIAITITKDASYIYTNIYAINCCILMQIDDSDSLNQDYSEWLICIRIQLYIVKLLIYIYIVNYLIKWIHQIHSDLLSRTEYFSKIWLILTTSVEISFETQFILSLNS